MNTIEGKELNLSDVIIYSTKEDANVIFTLSKNIEGELVTNKVLYSEENVDTLTRGMKQIKSIELSSLNGIEVLKVKYTDKDEAIFPKTRQSLLSAIRERQENVKREQVIRDTWDNLTPEQQENKKEANKKQKRTGLVSLIVAASLLGGAAVGGIVHHGKKNKDNENPYDSIQNMTQTEITESRNHSTVVKRADVTYAFDINDPEVISKKGLELYNEVNKKNMLLLTSGEIVKWDETLATEVVEYINGLYPASLKAMDIASAKAEMEKIEQAILLIDAASTSAENDYKNVINISNYVSNNKERVLMNNAFVIARRVNDEAVGNPVNGKIIESDEEFNKLNREYTNACDKLLNYIIDTNNDPVYNEASASTRWTICSILRDGLAIVPRYDSVIRTSKEETRKAEYRVVYYIDNVNDTVWYADKNELDVIGQEVYYEYKDCNKTGKKFSDTQMEEYYENNANIVKLGIEKELDDERVRAEKDFMDIMVLYEASYTK